MGICPASDTDIAELCARKLYSLISYTEFAREREMVNQCTVVDCIESSAKQSDNFLMQFMR